MLNRYMPGESRSLVMVSPDIGVEILLRAKRLNTLPLADPWEASFVLAQNLPAVREAVADLKPGDRMLMDRGAFTVLRTLRADPAIDTLAKKNASGLLAPLQQWALQHIIRRYRLRPIANDGLYTVVELEPR